MKKKNRSNSNKLNRFFTKKNPNYRPRSGKFIEIKGKKVRKDLLMRLG